MKNNWKSLLDYFNGLISLIQQSALSDLETIEPNLETIEPNLRNTITHRITTTNKTSLFAVPYSIVNFEKKNEAAAAKSSQSASVSRRRKTLYPPPRHLLKTRSSVRRFRPVQNKRFIFSAPLAELASELRCPERKAFSRVRRKDIAWCWEKKRNFQPRGGAISRRISPPTSISKWIFANHYHNLNKQRDLIQHLSKSHHLHRNSLN